MPCGMAKFIFAIRSQTLAQRVEGGGEKLQTVDEAMPIWKLQYFSDVVGITSIELEAY